MAIQVKISLAAVKKTLDPADYQDRWEESDDYEEGGPIPDDFVVACFTEDCESGAEDIADLFSSAAVTVEVL